MLWQFGSRLVYFSHFGICLIPRNVWQPCFKVQIFCKKYFYRNGHSRRLNFAVWRHEYTIPLDHTAMERAEAIIAIDLMKRCGTDDKKGNFILFNDRSYLAKIYINIKMKHIVRCFPFSFIDICMYIFKASAYVVLYILRLFVPIITN
jgi:hypothetical protein